MEERKRILIDALTARFSRDELAMDEFERLVSEAQGAKAQSELAVLEASVLGSAPAEARSTTGSAERTPAAAGSAADVQNAVAILSERRLRGDWLRGDKVAAVAILGSQIFDFRDVPLAEGPVRMEVLAVLGSVEIIVPPGLSVLMDAFPIAGDASVGKGVETRARAGRPSLVITGNIVLGSLNVRLG